MPTACKNCCLMSPFFSASARARVVAAIVSWAEIAEPVSGCHLEHVSMRKRKFAAIRQRELEDLVGKIPCGPIVAAAGSSRPHADSLQKLLPDVTILLGKRARPGRRRDRLLG